MSRVLGWLRNPYLLIAALVVAVVATANSHGPTGPATRCQDSCQACAAVSPVARASVDSFLARNGYMEVN
jgi:hypothetical protein